MKLIALFALVASSSAVSLTRWDRGYDDKNPHPGFAADSDGFDGRWQYHRVIPDNFQGEGSGDDQFVYSMLKNYSMEEATPDGHPTGHFYFNYPAAMMGANEILETHLGLKGKAKEDYINKYFDSTWKHFDTAGDGKIETERMSGFYRFLCANMQITLH